MRTRSARVIAFALTSLLTCPALAAPDVTEAFGPPAEDALEAPPAPALPDVELEAEAPEPPRPRARFSVIYGSAALGAVGGALLGGAVGLTLAGAIGCDDRGQGWMGGYTCTSGFFYLATIGALIGLPIGTAIGVALGLDAEGVPLDALSEGLIGLLLGSLPATGAILLHLATGQLSGPLVYALGVSAGMAPLVMALWTRAHLHHHGFAMTPTVTPVADGALVGLSGRF